MFLAGEEGEGMDDELYAVSGSEEGVLQHEYVTCSIFILLSHHLPRFLIFYLSIIPVF